MARAPHWLNLASTTGDGFSTATFTVSVKRDWLVIAEPRDPHTVHVIPRWDHVGHDDVGIDCICGVTVEHLTALDGSDAWLITHHSLDGREQNER